MSLRLLRLSERGLWVCVATEHVFVVSCIVFDRLCANLPKPKVSFFSFFIYLLLQFTMVTYLLYYLSCSDKNQNVGCSPPKFPTKRYIEVHLNNTCLLHFFNFLTISFYRSLSVYTRRRKVHTNTLVILSHCYPFNKEAAAVNTTATVDPPVSVCLALPGLDSGEDRAF